MIKNQARQKREEREKAVEAKRMEKARRENLLEEQFAEWTTGKEGRVEMALVGYHWLFQPSSPCASSSCLIFK